MSEHSGGNVGQPWPLLVAGQPPLAFTVSVFSSTTLVTKLCTFNWLMSIFFFMIYRVNRNKLRNDWIHKKPSPIKALRKVQGLSTQRLVLKYTLGVTYQGSLYRYFLLGSLHGWGMREYCKHPLTHTRYSGRKGRLMVSCNHHPLPWPYLSGLQSFALQSFLLLTGLIQVSSS